MKTPFLAVTLLAFSSVFAVAAEDNSISGAEMERLPAKQSGTTSNPTAKPDSTSLTGKAMKDHPGVESGKSGTTANPTAKPDESSLSGKAMKDHPGVGK